MKLCTALKVSETGFYKWKRNRTKMKRWQLLLVEIHEIIVKDPENDKPFSLRLTLSPASAIINIRTDGCAILGLDPVRFEFYGGLQWSKSD